MSYRHLVLLAALPLAVQTAQDGQADAKARAADLKARIEASPTLPYDGTTFVAKPPGAGWESGKDGVSS